jgi:hypothetical protein
MNVATLQPASNNSLARALWGLEAKMYEAADAEIQTLEGDFTLVEKQAMREGEALRMTNGLELAVVLLRGKILQKIVDRNLAAMHPNQYTTLREMAADCGISATELSKTQNLVGIVFPGLVELGYDIALLWEQIGKTKFNELVPYFRVLMTAEESESDIVNDAIEQMRDDVAATAQSSNTLMEPDQINRQVIDNLVHDGTHLPTRELRQSVRRTRTPRIPITFISNGGDITFMIAEINADQRSLFERQFADHTEQQTFELPSDPIAAALEAAQVPAIIRIADLLSTDF